MPLTVRQRNLQNRHVGRKLPGAKSSSNKNSGFWKTNKKNNGEVLVTNAPTDSAVVWFPSAPTALLCLLAARLVAAAYSHISDCDETYNYWEPIHYLIYGSGMQTWEYSPQYAIRSYASLWLWAAPARLLTALTDVPPVLVFYLLRALLATITALSEALFYKALCQEFGVNVARMWLGFAVVSCGAFVSSAAMLPSAWCAALTTAALACWWLQRLPAAVGLVAASALIGGCAHPSNFAVVSCVAFVSSAAMLPSAWCAALTTAALACWWLQRLPAAVGLVAASALIGGCAHPSNFAVVSCVAFVSSAAMLPSAWCAALTTAALACWWLQRLPSAVGLVAASALIGGCAHPSNFAVVSCVAFVSSAAMLPSAWCAALTTAALACWWLQRLPSAVGLVAASALIGGCAHPSNFAVVSCGAFVSSAAMLPSAWCAALTTAALACWWLQRLPAAVGLVAASALIGGCAHPSNFAVVSCVAFVSSAAMLPSAWCAALTTAALACWWLQRLPAAVGLVAASALIGGCAHPSNFAVVSCVAFVSSAAMLPSAWCAALTTAALACWWLQRLPSAVGLVAASALIGGCAHPSNFAVVSCVAFVSSAAMLPSAWCAALTTAALACWWLQRLPAAVGLVAASALIGGCAHPSNFAVVSCVAFVSSAAMLPSAWCAALTTAALACWWLQRLPSAVGLVAASALIGGCAHPSNFAVVSCVAFVSSAAMLPSAWCAALTTAALACWWLQRLPAAVGLVAASALIGGCAHPSNFAVVSCGAFVSSAAMLPSAWCAALTTAALACWWLQRLPAAVGLVAASALIGWPFAGILGAPIAIDIVVRRGRWLDFVKWCAVSLAALLPPLLAVDSWHYGRLVLAPWNIVAYNVLTEHGPDLYGVEPWTFYVVNGFLNFNITWVMALLCPLWLALCALLIPQARPRIQFCRPYWLSLMPLYLWLAVFVLQPHKEERFLYPVYSAVCLCGAVSVDCVQRLTFATKSRFGEAFDRCFGAASPSPARRTHYLAHTTFVMLIFLAVATLGGVSRILALYHNYQAPMVVLRSLPADPAAAGAAAAAGGEGEVSVCLGGEWHRSPSSFLLPHARYRLRFVPTEFAGQLPAQYAPGDNATRVVHSYFNDRNEGDPRTYLAPAACHYLVESGAEPPPAPWRPLAALPLLDSARSHPLFRAFYVPYLHARYTTFGRLYLLSNRELVVEPKVAQ